MSLLFGLLVGFSLGLTGGGGSIFAVPLLVYGLAVPVHRAVVISLAAVGGMALAGAVVQLRRGAAEPRTGLLFGLAGIVGAPCGAALSAYLPPSWLLGGFALLMLGVAVRLWRQANRRPDQAAVVRAVAATPTTGGPACRRDPEGRLQLSSRCALVLVVAGAVTGLLAGLFGVGGGFLIVPALVLVAALPIQRAVATSLLVIVIISTTGMVAHLLAGQMLDLALTAGFVTGGLAGMGLGMRVGRRLAGPVLQKLFAGMMVMVAVYMLARDF